jgi:hypothetical protein
LVERGLGCTDSEMLLIEEYWTKGVSRPEGIEVLHALLLSLLCTCVHLLKLEK